MVKSLPLADAETDVVDADDLLNIDLINIEADDSESDYGDTVDTASDAPPFVDAANAPDQSGINWSSPTRSDKVRFDKQLMLWKPCISTVPNHPKRGASMMFAVLWRLACFFQNCPSIAPTLESLPKKLGRHFTVRTTRSGANEQLSSGQKGF